MNSPWTSIPAPEAHSRLLRQVYEATLSGGTAPVPPRPLISESWRRSLAARVNPDGHRPPVVYRADEIAGVRSAHPLRAVLPLMRDLLVGIADTSRHVVIATDAEGTIFWREGPGDLCRSADLVGLSEGFRWTEDAIGTNAIGTALATDAPVQVYSAEHLVRAYHGWTCAAAPIHDPDTREPIGAIDVSGLLQTLHPAVIGLVDATAQLAEHHLRALMESSDERFRRRNLPHLLGLHGEPGALLTTTGRVVAAEPYGPWPSRIPIPEGADRVTMGDGREALVEPLAGGYLIRMPRRGRAAPRRPTLSLTFLGDRPAAVLDGHELPLTLRWAELLALFVLHPAGLTAEQVAFRLYGDEGNPATVRAEIHRLRARLGEAGMQARPYRLRAEVEADFLAARAALRAGDVRAATAVCRAPLLPGSESPAIRAESHHLVAGLRSAVLGHHDLDALWDFSQSEPGADDLGVFERLVDELPASDPRRAVAEARLTWLLSKDD